MLITGDVLLARLDGGAGALPVGDAVRTDSGDPGLLTGERALLLVGEPPRRPPEGGDFEGEFSSRCVFDRFPFAFGMLPPRVRKTGAQGRK